MPFLITDQDVTMNAIVNTFSDSQLQALPRAPLKIIEGGL
jgi:hypothetical protein